MTSSSQRSIHALPLALMLVFTALWLCPGCASLGGTVAGTGGILPYPAWVRAGSHLVHEGADAALFGLGEVRGIRNVALARSTADNRARAELARLLDAFVVQWLLACTPGVAGSEAGPGSAQQATPESLLKWLVASNLTGVQIVEHYFHPNDGAVFSLARLEMSHMVQHLQASAQLPAPLKSCLVEACDGVFTKRERAAVAP